MTGESMRLATFDLEGVDTDDDLAMEKAWNAFTEGLRLRGLRPAEDPTRWTDTSVTYRVFRIEHDELEHTLDFDISKLGKIATAIALVGVLLSTTLEKASWAADGLFSVVTG